MHEEWKFQIAKDQQGGKLFNINSFCVNLFPFLSCFLFLQYEVTRFSTAESKDQSVLESWDFVIVLV